MRNRELPVLFGFRVWGGGFIEGLGMDAMIVSILLLVVVSALEILAGYWLWKSLKKGGKLGIILLPLEMVFWIGYLDPAAVLVPLRMIILRVGWKTLH